jgi:hypothetical protein
MNEFESIRQPIEIAGGLSLFPVKRAVRKERIAVGREEALAELVRRQRGLGG